MSDRHIQMCRDFITARDQIHSSSKINEMVERRGEMWLGHSPELILALWAVFESADGAVDNDFHWTSVDGIKRGVKEVRELVSTGNQDP